MTAPDVPTSPPASATVRVSELITAAQRHLERFGDTPVGVVIHGPEASILHVENVVRTGYDRYEPCGEWVFEVGATSAACLDPAEEVIRRLRAEVAKLKAAASGARCGGCVDDVRAAAGVLGWDEDMIRAMAEEFAELRPIVVRGCPVSAEQLEEVRRRVASVMRHGLVGACPDPAGVDEESRRRWIGRIAEWSDWIHAQYAAVLTGDPPGARHELVARGGGDRS